uniref:Alpha 1,4-glycosyltransferase domain-containing protein n=2 Tax=Chrysotila carterae TaxID=13221 RepID=A0A7S4F752_CHRCT
MTSPGSSCVSSSSLGSTSRPSFTLQRAFRRRCFCFALPLLLLFLLSVFIVHDPKLSAIERLVCFLFHPADEHLIGGALRRLSPAGTEMLQRHRTTDSSVPVPLSRVSTAQPGQTGQQQQMLQQKQGSVASKLTLHQTVGSLSLTPEQQRWRESWRAIGFDIVTADDTQARKDVERLAEALGSRDVLRVYDGLATSVQRSDVWRYAILWLDGGVYADVDVYAFPPMTSLARGPEAVIFSESLALFEMLPRTLARLISLFALRAGLTDLVRLPQRRNCVMIAPARHPLMLATLKRIIAKFDADADAAKLPDTELTPEPTRTLELTGPGIFTDAVDGLIDEAARDGGAHGARCGASIGSGGAIVSALGQTGQPMLSGDGVGTTPEGVDTAAEGRYACGLRFVTRIEGHHYFRHVAQGSWKTYLVAGEVSGLKPHERTLRSAVLLLQSVGLVCYWLWGTRWRRAKEEGLRACRQTKEPLSTLRAVDVARKVLLLSATRLGALLGATVAVAASVAKHAACVGGRVGMLSRLLFARMLLPHARSVSPASATCCADTDVAIVVAGFAPRPALGASPVAPTACGAQTGCCAPHACAQLGAQPCQRCGHCE